MRHGGPILPSTSLGEPSAPSFSPRLFPTLATLWNESKIFARLMYKNRHQHRAALYYRKFQKLLRDMKALVRLEMVLQQQYERGGLGKEDTRELFKLLEESYSEGYFVPLTMTAMALIARVNALLDVILDQELSLATSKLSL